MQILIVFIFSDTPEECLDALQGLDNEIVPKQVTDVENKWIAHIQEDIQKLNDDYCQRQRWITTGLPQIEDVCSDPYIWDGCDISASEMEYLSNLTWMEYTQQHTSYESEFYQQYSTQHVEYEVSTSEYNKFEYAGNNFDDSALESTSEYHFGPPMTNEMNNNQQHTMTSEILQQCLTLQNNLTNVVEALKNNPATIHLFNYSCQNSMSLWDKFLGSLISLNSSLYTINENNS